MFLRWNRADTNSYYYYIGHHIQPILQTLDNYIKNCETLLPDTIDNIYNDIISVLTTGANNFVPARPKNFYKFWWDEELTALKEAAPSKAEVRGFLPRENLLKPRSP